MSEKLTITVESLAGVNEFLKEHTNYSLHVSDDGALVLAESVQCAGSACAWSAYAEFQRVKMMGGKIVQRHAHHYFLIARAYDKVLEGNNGKRPRGYMNSVREELKRNFHRYVSESDYYIGGDQCTDQAMVLWDEKGERKEYSLSDNVVSNAIRIARPKLPAKEKTKK